jgi:CLIP-associating protein 1/2
VGALEDTDGNVRECARQSVVELFIGPGVNDAARSDLKKEMVKKGVRKTTFDSVLSKVFVGATTSAPISDGSESGDGSAKNEYIPPSLVLAGRKPTVTSNGSSNDAGSSTFPRSASGSANETSRPPSRTVASPTIAETVGGGSSPDVRSVFVGRLSSYCLQNS